MGVLVNPFGWRVGSNIYWKVNSFVRQENSSILFNNERIYYLVIDSILTKLNTLFFVYGIFNFMRHSVFIEGKNLFVLVTLRFNWDALLRIKHKRRYKYFRIEQNKLIRRLSNLGIRTNQKLLYLTFKSRKILRLRREIMFLQKNAPLLRNNKRDLKALYKVLQKKLRAKRRLRFKLETYKYRLYHRMYSASRLFIWNRSLRVRRFLLLNRNNVGLRRIFYRKFFLAEQQIVKERKNLYRPGKWKLISFRKRIITRKKYGVLKRFVNFIPGYNAGFYLDHKRTLWRLQKISKRKKLRKRRSAHKVSKRFKKKKFFPYGSRYRKRHKRKIRLESWRKNPKNKLKPYRVIFRLFLLYYKFVPFFVELKKFMIRALSNHHNLGKIDVYILNVSKLKVVSAKILLLYVVKFLKRRRRVTKIVKLFYKIMRILNFFKKKFMLRGFKLLLAGRFLRRDRATFIWRSKGSVPLATKLAKIDFAACSVQMKYSRPIVKLWLCKR